MKPNTVKRSAKIDWKKDNLRHIRDHGLAMEFSDPAKTAFLRGLCGVDGKTEISVGKSSVVIETVGRVSRVYHYDAIGNGFDSYAIHYFSPAENLKFSFSRSETNREAYQVLNVAVFGNDHSRDSRGVEYAADILRCNSGAAQDALRTWASSSAWTLSGEAGMRAKALETKDAALRDAVRQAKTLVSDKLSQLEHARTRDFRLDHKNIRAALVRHVDACRATESRVNAALAAAREFFGDLERVNAYFTEPVEYGYGIYRDEPLAKTLQTFGASFTADSIAMPNGGWIDTKRYTRRIFFPARHATYSHEEVTANYKVSRGEGGTLRLSSGIVCPFTEPAALAWLRGETPAPSTQYGDCRKIEGRDRYGKAVVLVACGCHRIDVANDLGGEYAELLRPSHVVTLTSGTPAIDAKEKPAEFLARCEQLAKDELQATAEKLARGVAEYRQRKADLLKTEENNPSFLAELEKELEARKAAQAEAETAEQEGTLRFPGSRLEQINRQNRAALSAFLSAKIV